MVISVRGGASLNSSIVALLTERFASLQDPRAGRAKRHKFIDVIAIAIGAVICGADSWVDVELFGKAKQGWLSRLLELPNGIPSHDTFGRVFARLAPLQFEAGFTAWGQAVNEVLDGQVVAIDGKTVRRSHDRLAGRAAIHLVLNQIKMDDHSNAITAIPGLIAALQAPGRLCGHHHRGAGHGGGRQSESDSAVSAAASG